MQYNSIGKYKNRFSFSNNAHGLQVYPGMYAYSPVFMRNYYTKHSHFKILPPGKQYLNITGRSFERAKAFNNTRYRLYKPTPLNNNISNNYNGLAFISNPFLKKYYTSDIKSNSSQNHHNIETTMTILTDRVIVDMTEESDKEIESSMEDASKLANSLHHIKNPFMVEEEEIPLDGSTPAIDLYFTNHDDSFDVSPFPEFPRWNDKLASGSEEIVKADQSPDKPLETIVQESLAYFHKRYNYPTAYTTKDDYNRNIEE